ncbi:DUF4272 domain-containing protein [uncultured Chitinophaga sp.]|uniref:DUF4272 domain-containing protein n=1 Tax=uncultured Chitinophaga sp. TaxID=339340 RepID=UPI0025E5F8EA|nr:DUF4272 domain-containing protein [uncultured Chitinophaga sp.]
MENYTLYSHKIGFDEIVEAVKAAFPSATPSVNGDWEGKELGLHIKGGLFSGSKKLSIRYRERAKPSFNLDNADCPLGQQINGMFNYVASLPATNEQVRGLLLQKIRTINSECSFSVEPKLTADFETLLLNLSRQYDVFIFATVPKGKGQEQKFLDAEMNLVIDTDGNCGDALLKVQIDAQYFDNQAPARPDTEARKARTEEFLRSRGVKINEWLPFTESEEALELRSTKEITDRMYALAIIAAKGEGVEQERLDQAVKDFSVNSFSFEEQRVFDTVTLTEQDRINSIWRYEGLNVMMWALGLVKELVYPSTICEVSTIVGIVVGQSREALESQVKLRSKSEILDELDKIYRMNWACVDARLHGQKPGGELDSSVVYERHYALNWLTCYGNAEWDDVTTDT